MPNHPAAGQAEVASWLTFKAPWLDLPEPGRWDFLQLPLLRNCAKIE
jgi:hypothetical protein